MHDLLPRPIFRHIEMQATALQQPASGCTYDDLAQEATMGCWIALGRYDAARGASVANFLRARGTWAMVDALRAATHYGHVQYLPLDPVLPAPAWERDVLCLRQVRRAVNALPSRLRYILIKRYWREWTQARIARHLHISHGRVCQLEQRATRAVRALLDAKGDLHDD